MTLEEIQRCADDPSDPERRVFMALHDMLTKSWRYFCHYGAAEVELAEYILQKVKMGPKHKASWVREGF